MSNDDFDFPELFGTYDNFQKWLQQAELNIPSPTKATKDLQACMNQKTQNGPGPTRHICVDSHSATPTLEPPCNTFTFLSAPGNPSISFPSISQNLLTAAKNFSSQNTATNSSESCATFSIGEPSQTPTLPQMGWESKLPAWSQLFNEDANHQPPSLMTSNSTHNFTTSSSHLLVDPAIGTATAVGSRDAQNALNSRQATAHTVDTASPLNLSGIRSTSPTPSITSHENEIWQELDQESTRRLPTTAPNPRRTSTPNDNTSWLAKFVKNQWTTLDRINLAIKEQHPEAMEFLGSLKRNDKYKAAAIELTAQARLLKPLPSYQEALLEHYRTDLSPQSVRVCNTIVNIFKTNVHIGDLRTDVDRANAANYWWRIAKILHVLHDCAGKQRGLLFEGPPSSGKSLMMEIITSVYPASQIGQFNMQGSTSTFWLQPLIDKAFYVGEEIKLQTNTAQTIKLLLEGSPSLITDIKHTEGVPVPYKPTIITSNGDCYSAVSAEGNAIRERGLEVFFRDPIRVDCSRERKHHAEAWSFIARQALLRFPLPQHAVGQSEHLEFEVLTSPPPRY